jgi:hypothetical protein
MTKQSFRDETEGRGEVNVWQQVRQLTWADPLLLNTARVADRTVHVTRSTTTEEASMHYRTTDKQRRHVVATLDASLRLEMRSNRPLYGAQRPCHYVKSPAHCGHRRESLVGKKDGIAGFTSSYCCIPLHLPTSYIDHPKYLSLS